VGRTSFVRSHVHSRWRCDAVSSRLRPGGEREHGRLAPQHFRRRDRRHPHRLDLDVGSRLVRVDLQEHLTDAEGRAVVVGDDDLDLIHVGHCSGRAATMSHRFVACGVEQVT
jgi:hypothetical protein